MNTNYTKLSVKNDTKDDVEVFVTFAADNPGNTCCPSLAKVSDFSFLKKVNNLRGKFVYITCW